MAIINGRSANGNSGTTDVTTQAVTIPADVTVGEFMLSVAQWNAVITSAVTATAGWGLLGAAIKSDSASSTGLYSRVAQAGDGGDPFSVSWTAPTTTRAAVQLHSWLGVDPATPVSVSAIEATSGATHTTPTVTSPDEVWVVNILGFKHTGVVAWDAPAGMVIRDQFIQPGSGTNTILIADSNGLVPAGTIGGGVYTARNAANAAVSIASGVMWTIGLKPAPVAASRLKIWDGAAWVDRPANVWDGTQWVPHAVKVFDGTEWIT